MRWKRLGLGAVFLYFGFAVILSAQIAAFPSTVPLRQGITSIARSGRILGRLQGNTRIQLAVLLQLRNETALRSLIVAQNTPGSPYYRRFLTPAQFAAVYSPAPQNYAAVVRYMQGFGFQVQTTANRQLVLATGTASQVERAFSTELHTFLYQGKYNYANTSIPRVPAALAGVIRSVQGLDSREMHSSDYTDPVIMSATNSISPTGYKPSQISKAYDYPTLYGINGTGKTIAVATSGDFNDSDVQTFYSTFGITPAGYSRVNVQGGNNRQEVETTLDVEWSSILAPGAKEIVYIVSNKLVTSFTQEYNQIVTDNLADAVTSSWDECEDDISPASTITQDDGIFEQGAAQGQSWFIATGDFGAYECGANKPALGVTYPASSPFVTGTGGTSLQLSSSGSISSETAWSGSGGGTSDIELLPSWEYGSPYFANGMRWSADMAMDADPSPGMVIFWKKYWYTVGGTSIVAPFASALAAEIAQYKGSRLGIFAARLDQLANSSPHVAGEVLHDITSGNNGYYNAGQGWDPPTGWGSPDGYILMLNF